MDVGSTPPIPNVDIPVPIPPPVNQNLPGGAPVRPTSPNNPTAVVEGFLVGQGLSLDALASLDMDPVLNRQNAPNLEVYQRKSGTASYNCLKGRLAVTIKYRENDQIKEKSFLLDFHTRVEEPSLTDPKAILNAARDVEFLLKGYIHMHKRALLPESVGHARSSQLTEQLRANGIIRMPEPKSGQARSLTERTVTVISDKNARESWSHTVTLEKADSLRTLTYNPGETTRVVGTLHDAADVDSRVIAKEFQHHFSAATLGGRHDRIAQYLKLEPDALKAKLLEEQARPASDCIDQATFRSRAMAEFEQQKADFAKLSGRLIESTDAWRVTKWWNPQKGVQLQGLQKGSKPTLQQIQQWRSQLVLLQKLNDDMRLTARQIGALAEDVDDPEQQKAAMADNDRLVAAVNSVNKQLTSIIALMKDAGVDFTQQPKPSLGARADDIQKKTREFMKQLDGPDGLWAKRKTKDDPRVKKSDEMLELVRSSIGKTAFPAVASEAQKTLQKIEDDLQKLQEIGTHMQSLQVRAADVRKGLEARLASPVERPIAQMKLDEFRDRDGVDILQNQIILNTEQINALTAERDRIKERLTVLQKEHAATGVTLPKTTPDDAFSPEYSRTEMLEQATVALNTLSTKLAVYGGRKDLTKEKQEAIARGDYAYLQALQEAQNDITRYDELSTGLDDWNKTRTSDGNWGVDGAVLSHLIAERGKHKAVIDSARANLKTVVGVGATFSQEMLQAVNAAAKREHEAFEKSLTAAQTRIENLRTRLDDPNIVSDQIPDLHAQVLGEIRHIEAHQEILTQLETITLLHRPTTKNRANASWDEAAEQARTSLRDFRTSVETAERDVGSLYELATRATGMTPPERDPVRMDLGDIAEGIHKLNELITDPAAMNPAAVSDAVSIPSEIPRPADGSPYHQWRAYGRAVEADLQKVEPQLQPLSHRLGSIDDQLTQLKALNRKLEAIHPIPIDMQPAYQNRKQMIGMQIAQLTALKTALTQGIANLERYQIGLQSHLDTIPEATREQLSAMRFKKTDDIQGGVGDINDEFVRLNEALEKRRDNLNHLMNEWGVARPANARILEIEQIGLSERQAATDALLHITKQDEMLEALGHRLDDPSVTGEKPLVRQAISAARENARILKETLTEQVKVLTDNQTRLQPTFDTAKLDELDQELNEQLQVRTQLAGNKNPTDETTVQHWNALLKSLGTQAETLRKFTTELRNRNAAQDLRAKALAAQKKLAGIQESTRLLMQASGIEIREEVE